MKRRVLAGKNRPTYWPIGPTWLLALTQSVTEWPGWAYGVTWTLIALIWIVVAFDIFTAEEIEI